MYDLMIFDRGLENHLSDLILMLTKEGSEHVSTGEGGRIQTPSWRWLLPCSENSVCTSLSAPGSHLML